MFSMTYILFGSCSLRRDMGQEGAAPIAIELPLFTVIRLLRDGVIE